MGKCTTALQHEGETAVRCYGCGERFGSYAAWQDHARSHEAEARADRLQAEARQVRAENYRLKVQDSEAQANAKASESTIARLQAEVDGLRAEVRQWKQQAELDGSMSEQLADRAEKAEAEVRRLTEVTQRLRSAEFEEATKLRAELDDVAARCAAALIRAAGNRNWSRRWKASAKLSRRRGLSAARIAIQQANRAEKWMRLAVDASRAERDFRSKWLSDKLCHALDAIDRAAAEEASDS